MPWKIGPTPLPLVEVLRQVCRWPLLEALGAKGKESPAATKWLGSLVLDGKEYTTRFIRGSGEHHQSLSLILSQKDTRLQFKAHSKKVTTDELQPGDHTIDSREATFGRPATHRIDMPDAIKALQTYRTSTLEISIRRLHYPEGSLFEVARLRSPQAGSFEHAHQQLLTAGQALLALAAADK